MRIPKESLGSAIKYYLLFILLATVVTAATPIWLLATVGQKEINTIPGKITKSFPKDLEVKVKNGLVSTNAKEPYFIPIPGSENSPEQIKNLVVLDTRTPFSATKFHEYSTAVWVTKDSVFTDDGNQLKAIDLSSVSDLTINKGFVDSGVARVNPWLKYVTPVVSVIILVGIYIFYAFRLISFFVLAFLAWILLKIIKKPLSYGQTYKVVIYAATLGFIVEIVASLTQWFGFPFMFTLVTLLAVVFNFLPTKPTQKVTKAKKVN